MIASFRGNNFFLSNFYNAPVTIDGITYPNNECAFQAQKCMDNSQKMAFTRCSASDAKHMGRRVTMRPDWNSIRVSVMQKSVDAKFAQNSQLAAMLKATGSEDLVEGNTWNDTFWGVCNGRGANNLGKCLMNTRNRLP